MKNRIFITILTICIVLPQFCVFAKNAEVETDETSAFAASLYAADDIASEARVTFEYIKDEQETLANAPKIGCKAAFVADPVSGKVFYEKNAHKKMYPASTTKLLTALAVLENCDPEETAEVSQNAVDSVPEGYVTAGLVPGEEFSLYTLLQALLIPSANEAAVVLAEHVSGSAEAFAEICNERASELGCEDLHFVNPNGVHDDDHYCTAYDLYLIAKECLKYDVFNEIVSTVRFTVPATELHPEDDRTFENTNQLLFSDSEEYYDARCTGFKTGYTPEAGECLVAGSAYEDLSLISVVLGGETNGAGISERFSDTKTLFQFVYDNYAYKKIADKTVPLAKLQIDNATKETATLFVMIQTDIFSVAPSGVTPENVVYEISMPEDLQAPISRNQVLGTVTYKIDGLCYSTNLVAQHDVMKKPYALYNALIVLGAVMLILIFLSMTKKRKA